MGSLSFSSDENKRHSKTIKVFPETNLGTWYDSHLMKTNNFGIMAETN